MENNYLFTVPYKDLSYWSYGFLAEQSKNVFKYPMEKLGKYLKRYEERVDLIADKLFTRITIKLYGLGIVKRDEALGKDIKTQGQFYIKAGQFIYSNIDARNGAFGIVPKELNNAIITNSFTSFECDTSSLLPEYLVLVLSTNYYMSVFEKISVGTTNRRSVKPEALLNIKIPIPLIEKQQELLDEYNSAIKYAEAIKPICSWLLVEKQMNEFLQLKNTKSEIEGDFLSTIKYSSLLTWDVKNRQGHELFETDKYNSVMLNNLVEINPKLSKQLKDDDTVSFIPMECVSDFDGSVKEYRECKYSTKGFTKFENGDIIWAKITPCMQNGKSAIVDGMKNGVGYGSTEFYVLRRKSDKVLTEYLYYILRSIKVRTQAVNYFSGSAGQQRVRKSFLQELRIPLPSIQEQKELIALLDEKKKEMNDKQAEYQIVRQQAKENFENAIFN